MSNAKLPFPEHGATRAEIDAWLKANAPTPPPSDEPAHEAPPVENGPSLMCNACGLVRVGMFTPFCKGCTRLAGGMA